MTEKQKAFYRDSFVELIRRCSTDLPKDVEDYLKKASLKEIPDSISQKCLQTILENIQIARAKDCPMCQDTGTNLYFLEIPFSIKHKDVLNAIKEATLIATEKNYLRKNTIDSLSGKGIDSNWSKGQPFFHIEQTETNILKSTLILKGGGCENVGRQYSLPDKTINAERDIKGIKKCILDAVYQAQGRGCAPAILGVGIGGDRVSSYLLSKQQFLRSLGSINPNPDLAEMEIELLDKANSLGIGPMGYGGKTSVLGIFIDSQSRIPASYFVSVSYMCWSFRRHTMLIKENRCSYV